MKKEIIISVVSALLAALITYFVSESKFIYDQRHYDKLANKMVEQRNFYDTLISLISDDSRFLPKNEKDILSVIINGENWVMKFKNGYQICWGSKNLEYPTSNQHTRKFSFEFANEFSKIPTVTTGIHSNYSNDGDAFGVYTYSLDTKKYEGGIIEFTKGQSPAPVLMQYIAIGKY